MTIFLPICPITAAHIIADAQGARDRLQEAKSGSAACHLSTALKLAPRENEPLMNPCFMLFQKIVHGRHAKSNHK